MSDNIKLPPLPKASKMHDIPGYDEEELKDYARAAVLAEIERLTAERDAAQAEAQWLREALIDIKALADTGGWYSNQAGSVAEKALAAGGGF